MIELTEEPPPPINPKILNEGTKYHCPLWMHYWVHKEAAASPHARISFFKNGKFQGYAFEDIWCGTYYPAASFYYGGCATANFGPDFRYPPQCPVSRAGVKVEDGGGGTFVRYRPISESARELQVWNKVALEEEKLSCLSGAGSRSLTPPLPSPSPGLSQPPPRAPVPLPLSLLLVARRRCSCTHPPTSRSVPLQRSRFPCARDRRQRNRRQRTPHTATLIPSLCPMRQTHNGTARRRRRPQVQPRRRTRSARRARFNPFFLPPSSSPLPPTPQTRSFFNALSLTLLPLPLYHGVSVTPVSLCQRARASRGCCQARDLSHEHPQVLPRAHVDA